ncbi:MAG: PTS glucose transporter subunit IIA, partial [Lachnospiraceae bacterium]|nr:PTS glucose transporter subunit IIA [Lachnospiraceae bacterium]
ITKDTVNETIVSPLKGKVIPLTQVNDAVFSQGVLGEGAAVIPEEGCIYAPFDGKIASVFDTKHAVCLVSEKGTELLIHVGIDTVNLEGKPFIQLKQAGESIKTGDKILEFDIDAIKDAGYDTVTPVIVSNVEESNIKMTSSENVNAGDLLINVTN